ncbi:hypothetical protein AAF712_015341, partial [Marasmius tenuissimus]
MEVKRDVKACAPGKHSSEYLAVWHTVISERYRNLSEDEKKLYKEEANKINENQIFKPPEDHIIKNQELLEMFIYAQLSTIICDNWSQCGDVSFAVHTIEPRKNSGGMNIK